MDQLGAYEDSQSNDDRVQDEEESHRYDQALPVRTHRVRPFRKLGGIGGTEKVWSTLFQDFLLRSGKTDEFTFSRDGSQV